MHKRTVAAALVFAALAASGLAALPKIAVLDAVIPDKMDSSVIVPVTDKIAEEIVNSRQYAVLDRANIEQVLREKEFQVSGLVDDSEIKQAGKYLGADFVVVARVSLVESTYFISAKMINVETGAVVAQVSDEQEGKASVLIAIAGRVGKKLMGGVVQVAAEPKAKTETTPAASAATTTGGKPRPRSTLTVQLGLPVFLGTFAEATDDWTSYWTGSSLVSNDSTASLGFGARFGYFLLPPLYAAASLDYAKQSISYDDSFGSSYTEMVLSSVDLGASAGLGFLLGASFQVYVGARIGLSVTALGDFWTTANWTNDWSSLSSTGLVYGLEAGAKLILFKLIVLAAHMDFMLGSVGEASDFEFAGYFNTPSSSYSSPYGLNTLRLYLGAGIALGGGK